MPRPIKPLALRKIPGGIAHARSLLGAGRVWHAFAGEGPWSRFELRFRHSRRGASSAAQCASAVALRLRSGAGCFGLADAALLHLGSGIPLDEGWPLDVFRGAAQLACACMNRQLVDALGGAFELLRVHPADPDGEASLEWLAAGEIGLELMLRPSQGDELHVVSLWSDVEAVASLLAQERWERIADPGPCGWSDHVVCRAEVSLAVARMPLRVLRTVVAGDVIVAGGLREKDDPDESDVGEQGIAHARLGRVLLELAMREGSAAQSRARLLVLRSWRVRRMTRSDRTLPVEPDARDGDRGQDVAEGAYSAGGFPVESIDVAVHFVAGHIEMSVGALRALEPGSLIPLSGPANARVDIVVHGTRIGIGEMVEIDDRLAIEVLEMCRTS